MNAVVVYPGSKFYSNIDMKTPNLDKSIPIEGETFRQEEPITSYISHTVDQVPARAPTPPPPVSSTQPTPEVVIQPKKKSINEIKISLDSKEIESIQKFLDFLLKENVLTAQKKETLLSQIKEEVSSDKFDTLNEIEKLAYVANNNTVFHIIKKHKVDFFKRTEECLRSKIKVAGSEVTESEAKKPKDVEKKSQNIFINVIKTGFFTFVGAVSTVYNAINSYVSTSTVLDTLSGMIPEPIVIGISLIFGAIKGVMFFSFELEFLKKVLGINYLALSKKSLDLDKQELSHIKEIQTILLHLPPCSTNEELVHYNDLRKICNAAVAQKKTCYMKVQEETKFYKFKKYVFAVSTSILNTTGTYFFMKATMTSFAICVGATFLVGTPVGWALLGVGVFALFVVFLARLKTVLKTFDLELDTYNELQKKLDEDTLLQNGRELVRPIPESEQISQLREQNENGKALHQKHLLEFEELRRTNYQDEADSFYKTINFAKHALKASSATA